MVVGGKYTSRGGVAALGSRTPIKLGPAHLYFLLPENVETGGGSGAGAGGQAPSNGELGPVVRPLSSMSGSDAVETPRKEHSPLTGQGHLPSPQGRPQTGAAPIPPVAPSVAAAKPSPVSFDEMVGKAFGSPELSAMAAAEGLSSGDVQNWVMQNFPVWNEEGAKMRTLAVGIEAALAKNYASSGADRWKESPAHIAKRAKIAADHPSPAVTNASAVLASEQPGAQASSNGTLPHVSSAAPGTAPGVQIALGQPANAEQMTAAPVSARQPAPAAAVPAAKVAMAAAVQPAACATVAGSAAAAAGSGIGILVQGSVGGEEEGGGIDVGIEDHM